MLRLEFFFQLFCDRFNNEILLIVLLMFCIELFMVLIDELIVVMIGAARVVVIETFVIDAFAPST